GQQVGNALAFTDIADFTVEMDTHGRELSATKGAGHSSLIPRQRPSRRQPARRQAARPRQAQPAMNSTPPTGVTRPSFRPARVIRYRLPEKHRRSEEHTSELQSRENLVCRLLLEKKK